MVKREGRRQRSIQLVAVSIGTASEDLCGCATICEACGGVAEWRGDGNDDGKGTRVVDKVNVSLAKAVSGGSCDVGRKLAGGCIVSRCSTGGAMMTAEPQLAQPRARLQITFLSTEISSRMIPIQ